MDLQSNNIKEIKFNISVGNIPTALKLCNSVEVNEEYNNNIILLSTRYYIALNAYNQKQISFEDYEQRCIKIAQGVLFYINAININMFVWIICFMLDSYFLWSVGNSLFNSVESNTIYEFPLYQGGKV